MSVENIETKGDTTLTVVPLDTWEMSSSKMTIGRLEAFLRPKVSIDGYFATLTLGANKQLNTYIYFFFLPPQQVSDRKMSLHI